MFALGFVSVFDQITEGLPGTAAGDIFQAYMKALQEDPEQYRRCVTCDLTCKLFTLKNPTVPCAENVSTQMGLCVLDKRQSS